MKKKNIKRKLPKYAPGTASTNSGNPNITGTVAGYLGNVITDLASSMNMTTGHEQDAERIRNSINYNTSVNSGNDYLNQLREANVMNTYQPAYIDRSGTGYDTAGAIGNVGGGAAAGAAAGSVIPGIGTAIGAAVGGLVGGIKSLFNRRKVRKRRAEVRAAEQAEAERRAEAERQADVNMLNVQNQMLRDQYEADNADNIQIANTYAKGGVVMQPNAIVDHNEVIRTPDGTIDTVTEGSSNVTDNVLASLPEGSQILSDKLKIPGTNKSFASEGRKLDNIIKKAEKNESNGSIAKTTAELNKKYANREYDKLLALQEGMKNTKKKSKLPKYVNGTDRIDYTFTVPDINYGLVEQDLIENPILDDTAKQRRRAIRRENLRNWANNNWSNIATGLATLAPVGYNIAKGLQDYDTVEPTNVKSAEFYNPLGASAIRTMRNRYYNINPELEQNRVQTAIGRNNIRKYNTNTGANVAADVALTAGRMRADTEAYARKNNIENQYKAETANTMLNVGNQIAEANRYARQFNEDAARYAYDINARAKAANEAMIGTGLSQLSNFIQNQQLMSNQRNRDMAGLAVWEKMAELGMGEQDIIDILNEYGSKRKISKRSNKKRKG